MPDPAQVVGILGSDERIARLECVRLAYRPDKSAEAITEMADKLSDFVLRGKPAPEGAKVDKARRAPT